jgi:hypothetical protein
MYRAGQRSGLLLTESWRQLTQVPRCHEQQWAPHLVQDEQHAAAQAVADHQDGHDHDLGGLTACMHDVIWLRACCHCRVWDSAEHATRGALDPLLNLFMAYTTPSVAMPTSTILCRQRHTPSFHSQTTGLHLHPAETSPETRTLDRCRGVLSKIRYYAE